MRGGVKFCDTYGIGANLQSALDELKAFFKDTGVADNGKVALKFTRCKVSGRESYKLSVSDKGIELVAEDFSKTAEVKIDKTAKDSWTARILLPALTYGNDPRLQPAWLYIRRDAQGSRTRAKNIRYTWPQTEQIPVWRLNLGPIRPDQFGRIIAPSEAE